MPNPHSTSGAGEVTAALEEAILVYGDVLDRLDQDRDECASPFADELCLSTPCQVSGCYVDKLRRAVAALRLAQGTPA
jgi:hypothetical protein